jgi:hypothetical protein
VTERTDGQRAAEPEPTSGRAPIRSHGGAERSGAPPVPGRYAEALEVDAAEFQEATGERIEQVLALDTWRQGEDLAGVYDRIEREVSEALHKESEIRKHIREHVFPVIGSRAVAPRGAGVYRVTANQIKEAQEKVLFNGGVEACDGTVAVHDTLPLTIIQIGVSLVSYAGEQGSWVQRIFRRDIRQHGRDPIAEALDILERRQQRAGLGRSARGDVLSELLRRGLMTYSERAVLLKKSSAPWRMGHGQPAPYELITGSGNMELLHASLGVLRELMLDHQRYIFVPSEPRERVLLTLGEGLLPYEFAIVETLERRLVDVIEKGNLRGADREAAASFFEDVAPKTVIGVYRTSESVPPYIFYAHEDHAEDAALIAMADSVLQAHRGFPVLIDIAHSACDATFGPGAFRSTIEASYAASGEPLAFLRERETRF